MIETNLLPVEEALERLLAAARPVADVDEVATLEACGRVLARAQRSGLDVPPLDNSAMDGYALRCVDVPVEGARLRVTQRITAGTLGRPLEPGTAARIFTGAPVPDGADAVAMQEDCTEEDGGVVVRKVPAPGQWIRRAGSDVRRGAVVLEAGRRLAPQDIGLAASVGLGRLPVYRRVRLGLLFTGDELVTPGAPLPPGKIYNSNRYTLTGLALTFGCELCDYGIVPDSLEATRAMLRRAAAECDLIVTSGGVSVGEADFVRPAVEAEGALHMWRIAMKPGRPLAFGRIGEAAFIGLPGNPVSSFVTFLLFVRPFLLRTQGVTDVMPRAVEARADFDWSEPDVRREYLRVKWNAEGGLDLYPTQDSAVLTSTVWADGLVDNPPRRVIRRGDRVSVLPFAELYR